MTSENYTKLDDRDLAKRCAKSDRLAQKVLYERYYSKMYSLCLRYSDSKDDAKDALHDGFILLFSKIGSYRGSGSLEGWIRRLFVNNMLMKIRKNDLLKESTNVEDVSWNIPVKESVYDKLRGDDVVKLISQMPQGYRLIFNMVAIEGYSYEEVAKMLEVEVVSVRSQLSRARNWLKVRIIKMEEM